MPEYAVRLFAGRFRGYRKFVQAFGWRRYGENGFAANTAGMPTRFIAGACKRIFLMPLPFGFQIGVPAAKRNGFFPGKLLFGASGSADKGFHIPGGVMEDLPPYTRQGVVLPGVEAGSPAPGVKKQISGSLVAP
jgi:hypothetical protein